MRGSMAQQPSRRDFLRLSAAAGVGLATGASAQQAGAKLKGPVAIVGGGISGLTAAYRLSRAGVEVHLYEVLERFGGRMWTKRDFTKDGMFCELGGELVDTPHEDLIKLCEELSLPLQSLKEGDAGREFFHFGGKIYNEDDAKKAFEPLAARIAKDVEGIMDEKEENYTDKGHALDAISLADYLKQAGAGVDRWFLQMLEAAYVPEYGLDLAQQSALNMIDFIGTDMAKPFEIFGESDEAMRIQGGNETLPATLHRLLMGKVKLHSGHKLVRISEVGSSLKLSFATDQKIVEASYEHVVMTLPFTLLRSEVEGMLELKLSAEKLRAIKEMGYGANLKAMYGFTGKPWRKASGGRDYFCNGSVYTDQPFQSCWETSRGQSGESGIITNFMGGSPVKQYGPERIDAFLAEFEKVFPGARASADAGVRTMMNWTKMKTIKASYSAPTVGQYCWVYEAAATPELDGRLIFAGEHTSIDHPGYMNGGVETGNRAARELLGEAEG